MKFILFCRAYTIDGTDIFSVLPGLSYASALSVFNAFMIPLLSQIRRTNAKKSFKHSCNINEYAEEMWAYTSAIGLHPNRCRHSGRWPGWRFGQAVTQHTTPAAPHSPTLRLALDSGHQCGETEGTDFYKQGFNNRKTRSNSSLYVVKRCSKIYFLSLKYNAPMCERLG